MFISATCLAGAYGDKLAGALEKGHQLLLTLLLFFYHGKDDDNDDDYGLTFEIKLPCQIFC